MSKKKEEEKNICLPSWQQENLSSQLVDIDNCNALPIHSLDTEKKKNQIKFRKK